MSGSVVSFTATLNSAPTDEQAYRVVIEKAGINGVVYAGHLSLTGTKTITDNVTITAADVKVTPVAAPKITGVTWTATSVTITFDGNAKVVAAGLTKKSFADGNATLVDITPAYTTSVRSVTYSITGGVLQTGDTLTLDLSKFTDAAYGGQVTATPAAADTVTLNSDGTGTLS